MLGLVNKDVFKQDDPKEVPRCKQSPGEEKGGEGGEVQGM